MRAGGGVWSISQLFQSACEQIHLSNTQRFSAVSKLLPENLCGRRNELIGPVNRSCQSVCLSSCLPACLSVCLSWSTRQLKVVAGNWDKMRCKIASELNWPHLLYMTSSYWILTERQPCLPVSFITLTIHCAIQLHTPIISSLPFSSCEHYYLNNLLATWTGTENLFSYESHNVYEMYNNAVELKNKNQLDVTYYFIVLLIGSTCFGHYYVHHQELTTTM